MYKRKSMKSIEIYGITGLKGHGKDTLALAICGHKTGSNFKITHFADALKGISREVFGLTSYDVESQEGKESFFEVPITIDNFLESLERVTGLAVLPKGLIAKTPRELLQYVGSEYIRSCDKNYWIRQVEDLTKTHSRLLIGDTRFKNEMEMVRNIGGKVIRVIRIDAPGNKDLHQSELDGLEVVADLTLGVRTGDLGVIQRVSSLLAQGKWESVMRYDYTRINNALRLYQEGATLKQCGEAIGAKNGDSKAFRYILSYYGIPQRGSHPKKLSIIIDKVHNNFIQPDEAFSSVSHASLPKRAGNQLIC